MENSRGEAAAAAETESPERSPSKVKFDEKAQDTAYKRENSLNVPKSKR